MAEKNYYEILGVPPSAGPGEIRAVYRRLAFELHPDRNPSPEAQGRFQQVIQAYAVLSDPEKRRDYDALLFEDNLVITSALNSDLYGIDELYDQTAKQVSGEKVRNLRQEYLTHLKRSRRRRTLVQTVISLIIVFLLIFFGFKPLNDSSLSVAPTFDSNENTNSSSVDIRPGTNPNSGSTLNQSLVVVQGPAGPQGVAGPAGRDGRIGVDGIPGPAGAAGADGLPGKDGTAGPAGPAGPAGAAGIAGPAGAPGAAGPAGAPGAAGPAGAAGAQGPAGRDGTDATVYTVRPNIGAVTGGIYPCNQNLSDTSTVPNLSVTMDTQFDVNSKIYTLKRINISGFTSACYGVTVGVNIIMSSTAIPANAIFQCIGRLPNSLSVNDIFSFTSSANAFTTGVNLGCTKYSGWGADNGTVLNIETIDASKLERISLIVSG